MPLRRCRSSVDNVPRLNNMASVRMAGPVWLIGRGTVCCDKETTCRFAGPAILSNYYQAGFDGLRDEAQRTMDAKRRQEWSAPRLDCAPWGRKMRREAPWGIINGRRTDGGCLAPALVVSLATGCRRPARVIFPGRRGWSTYRRALRGRLKSGVRGPSPATIRGSAGPRNRRAWHQPVRPQ
jgi:hypothetical protein